jgi:diacylglycerol kinase family enzyme/3-methyladenine DNA glycosylase AlkD
MYILFTNPNSFNGRDGKLIKRIGKYLKKIGEEYREESVFSINETKTFLSNLDETDKLVFIGGDGTINKVANTFINYNIKNEIYLAKKGTGNDFARSIKNKKLIIDIKKYLKPLPSVRFGTESAYFLNGVGLGADGQVCHFVNHSEGKKNKLNYLKNTLRAFIQAKPCNASYNVDGVEFTHKKVWFSAAMNSQYFGGGMKVAPKANREEDLLYLIVVKRFSRLALFFVFISIYFGLHFIFKRSVLCYSGKHIKVTYDSDTYFQMDGETTYPINEIEVFSQTLSKSAFKNVSQLKDIESIEKWLSELCVSKGVKEGPKTKGEIEFIYKDLKEVGEAIGVNHTLSLELINHEDYCIQILGTFLLDSNKIELEQVIELIRESENPYLIDELSLFCYQNNEKIEYIEAYLYDKTPSVERFGWNIVVFKIMKDNYADLDIDALLQSIEKRLKEADKLAQSSMNKALCEIGVYCDEFMEQAILVGETVGPLSKRASLGLSTFAPDYIKANRARQVYK